MRYYKVVADGLILCVGTGGGGDEISEEEYNTILSAIANKPSATATTDYLLKTDLTWEPYEIEPPDPDPELDDSAALEILMGGAT